jgi:hypothetical protein
MEFKNIKARTEEAIGFIQINRKKLLALFKLIE